MGVQSPIKKKQTKKKRSMDLDSEEAVDPTSSLGELDSKMTDFLAFTTSVDIEAFLNMEIGKKGDS